MKKRAMEILGERIFPAEKTTKAVTLRQVWPGPVGEWMSHSELSGASLPVELPLPSLHLCKYSVCSSQLLLVRVPSVSCRDLMDISESILFGKGVQFIKRNAGGVQSRRKSL